MHQRTAGSSPLARGLPHHLTDGGLVLGIIPARAGFTPGPSAGAAHPADHPRSRGVYPGVRRRGIFRGGSSPLARGLQRTPQALRSFAGIIPARAGFTGTGRTTGRRRWDHPRSRGVYRVARDPSAASGGSSPLARGLLAGFSKRFPRQRIIPARAGFTLSAPAPSQTAWDHPRSRGVYDGTIWSVPSFAGSSPLARGLRIRGISSVAASGIIPARAGFTGDGPGAPAQSPDHPRSRGVYTRRRAHTPCSQGSSPLARGLHEGQ